MLGLEGARWPSKTRGNNWRSTWPRRPRRIRTSGTGFSPIPKETIESELGMRFPESLRVTVHEEKVNQLHVVLPIDLQTDDELRLGRF